MPTDTTDLADHAKHLRSVHFTLVTLTLALALASQLVADSQLLSAAV